MIDVKALELWGDEQNIRSGWRTCRKVSCMASRVCMVSPEGAGMTLTQERDSKSTGLSSLSADGSWVSYGHKSKAHELPMGYHI